MSHMELEYVSCGMVIESVVMCLAVCCVEICTQPGLRTTDRSEFKELPLYGGHSMFERGFSHQAPPSLPVLNCYRVVNNGCVLRRTCSVCCKAICIDKLCIAITLVALMIQELLSIITTLEV